MEGPPTATDDRPELPEVDLEEEPRRAEEDRDQADHELAILDRVGPREVPEAERLEEGRHEVERQEDHQDREGDHHVEEDPLEGDHEEDLPRPEEQIREGLEDHREDLVEDRQGDREEGHQEEGHQDL